jgi:hypothetical protein
MVLSPSDFELQTPFGPILLESLALTEQQATFIRQYVHHGHVERAALEAKYSAQTARSQAHRFFPVTVDSRDGLGTLTNFQRGCWAAQCHRHGMMAAVERRAIEIQVEHLGLTRAYVLKNLMSVVERSLQQEAVLDEDGNATGEYKFNAAGANKALELLGRSMGMFIDRKHMLIENVSKLGAEEIDESVKQMRSELSSVEARIAALQARDVKAIEKPSEADDSFDGGAE